MANIKIIKADISSINPLFNRSDGKLMFETSAFKLFTEAIYIINSSDNTKVPNRQKVESYLVYIMSNVNNVYSFQLYQYLSHWTQLHNQTSRNRGRGAYL